MSTTRLSEAIDALIRQFLRQNAGYAPLIADIADHVARLARGIEPAPGDRPVEPTPAVPAATPPPVVERPEPPATRPAPPPAAKAQRPASPPLASGYVPLKLADGEVTHVRVAGTGADIAAARNSLQDAGADDGDQELRRFHPPDLELIATRSLLKAQACRASLARRAAPAADEPDHNRAIGALIAQGKQLDNCYLWMVNRSKPQPSDAALTMIAAAYENLASAARLCQRVPRGSRPDRRTTALGLLAESQSALRVLLEDTWLTQADRDQDDAFRYLDESTSYEQLFIARHMKLSDPADPAAWPNLQARLASFMQEVAADEDSQRKLRTLVTKVRHHARRLIAHPGDDADHDWSRIDEALEGLLKAGRGRDPDVVEVLRSAAAASPPPARFTAVSRALAAERQDESPPVPESAPDKYSEEVLRVRAMLSGARCVIIGGERREDAARRIRDAFELADVDWVSLTEHGSTAAAEAPIRRPETRLVLVLIRLVGHLHAEEVAEFCDRHGKPLVRLPAGYNPERIAAEVIEQVSHRLSQAAR
ncbi:MAG: hypothetical protein AMXMBFR58_10910 [Phycisphaerae bacterium]